jgi:prevent-host-death family protein
MTDSVNIHYAKTHLSALIKQVREGAVITISSAGTPVAKLVPLAHAEKRAPGGFSFGLDDRFFEPLPPDEVAAWEK